MAAPTELAQLTAELKGLIPESYFRFERASKAQGEQLLLCRNWNRKGRRSSQTLYDKERRVFRKPKLGLATDQRVQIMEAARQLTNAWIKGADTRQRRKRCEQPTSSMLAMQRRVVFDGIRARSAGHRCKLKHHRHATALFLWLDQALDAPSAIEWAGEGSRGTRTPTRTACEGPMGLRVERQALDPAAGEAAEETGGQQTVR